ncbi:hypothetical protein ABTX85_35995 [Streptomyces sp. NPDC096097]|uniref:hypothetical protein n=1 Tax=Streptomyces sp. NPDC096097 TaxID=3155546 RepID=UPI00331DD67B
MVNTLARAVLAPDDEIARIDAQIAIRFRARRDANVVISMPGTGPLLGSRHPAAEPERHRRPRRDHPQPSHDVIQAGAFW